MSFLVLNVLHWSRDAVAWAMLNIDQHVVDWFRHVVLAEVADGVRFQTSRTTKRQVRRTWKTDRSRRHRHTPDRRWAHSGDWNILTREATTGGDHRSRNTLNIGRNQSHW